MRLKAFSFTKLIAICKLQFFKRSQTNFKPFDNQFV